MTLHYSEQNINRSGVRGSWVFVVMFKSRMQGQCQKVEVEGQGRDQCRG